MAIAAGYGTLNRQAASLRRDMRTARLEQTTATTGKRTPLGIARDLGIALDDWQRDALLTDLPGVLLLVSRQGGKGVVATMLALAALVDDPGSTTVIVSKTERQAKRLMKRIRRSYKSLANVSSVISEGLTGMELLNGSEIIALPGDADNVRGIEAVDLLVIDEAAVVSDDLYQTVRPMLATTRGRCIALTTPKGKRGWFYQEWTSGGPSWHRTKITAHDIPRIDPAWLADERAKIGEWWFEQEYLCEFKDQDDQLFATDLVDAALVTTVGPLVLPMFAGREAA